MEKFTRQNVACDRGGSMSATPSDLFLFASSLATASAVGSQNVRAAQAHRRVPAGAWAYPGSNEKRDDVIVALAKRGVVLLGETHDQAAHHRWQLHTIAALFSHRPDMAIGFEMFPRRVQPVVCTENLNPHIMVMKPSKNRA
jgi:hypothetical protein